MTIWGHVLTKERMKTSILKAAFSDRVDCLSPVLACFPYFIYFLMGSGCFEAMRKLFEHGMIILGLPKLGSESGANSQMAKQ